MPPEDVLRNWQRRAPFIASLEIDLVSASDGVARMFMPFSGRVENRKGNIHGGAIATLADVAMGHAIRCAKDGIFSMSTVSMNVNYLSPGAGDLTALAKCVKFGRSICFADVEISDASGTVVASATGTFKLLKPTAPEPAVPTEGAN